MTTNPYLIAALVLLALFAPPWRAAVIQALLAAWTSSSSAVRSGYARLRGRG